MGVMAIDPAILQNLARKYVWWRHSEEAVKSPSRIIAQVMNIGDFDDVRMIAENLGESYLRNIIQSAETGQFSERSWAYWHYRLGMAEIDKVPALPARRLE